MDMSKGCDNRSIELIKKRGNVRLKIDNICAEYLAMAICTKRSTMSVIDYKKISD